MTTDLAVKLGRNLRGGEVIELLSDLGGGKTTFTKGLAQAVGSHDKVHSPSFTIENEYKSNNLVIHHLDFYRLADAGIMRSQLAEILKDPRAVVVVEWADIVNQVLPPDRLTVEIQVTGDQTRRFKFTYAEEYQYLMRGL